MKIAISAQGRGPESPLDPRFGRTSGFVLFDTDSNAYDYLDHSSSMDQARGAGIRAAQVVADAGVSLLITGREEPKAEAALKQAGVTVFFSEQETVAQALQEYRAAGQATGQRAGKGSDCRREGGSGRGLGSGQGGGRGSGQGSGSRREGGSGRGRGSGN